MEKMEPLPQTMEIDTEKLFKEAKEYFQLNPNHNWYSSYYRKATNNEGYIISKEWIRKWKKYVNYAAVKRNEIVKNSHSQHPGKIDNDNLLLPSSQYYITDDPEDILNTALKTEVKEKYHYSIKPKVVWDFLHSIYGGTAIKRRITSNSYQSYFDVNFQPVLICIIPKAQDNNCLQNIIMPKQMYIHKSATIIELKERIIKVLNTPEVDLKLNQQNFRLWRADTTNFTELSEILAKVDLANYPYKEETHSEEGSRLVNFPGYCLEYFRNKPIVHIISSTSNLIVVELSSLDQKYIFRKFKNVKLGYCGYCMSEKPLPICCNCKEIYYCCEKCMINDMEEHLKNCSFQEELNFKQMKKQDDSCMATVGLENLGNTCYLNSGLQCLSHTFQLSNYFLTNLYEKDLNFISQQGSKGRLVLAYSKLIKEMWYGVDLLVQPIALKQVLGSMNEMYKGFQQHDTVEFISLVLETLHEDMNRVREKKTKEIKASTSENIDEESEERWNDFLSMNQSILVDLFYGQNINRLRCPKCDMQSYQYDSYNIISLPVNSQTELEVSFEYVPYDVSQKPIHCKKKLSDILSVDQFRILVGSFLKIDPYSFIIVCIDKSTNDAERIVGYKYNAKDVLNYYIRRNDVICLLEINPSIWKSKGNIGFYEVQKKAFAKNIHVFKQVQKFFKEDKFDGIIIKKHNVRFISNEEEYDFNNGIDLSIIKLLLHTKIFDSKYSAMSGSFKKTDILYPRYLHISKSTTLQQLHCEIFGFYRPLFYQLIKLTEAENKLTLDEFIHMSNSDARNALITLLSDDKYTSFFNEGNLTYKLPYIIQVNKSIDRVITEHVKCYYCEKSGCRGCEIKADDKTTIEHLMKKRIMLNNENYTDNNMLYCEKGYTQKLDFEIEVIFHEDFLDKVMGLDANTISTSVTIESSSIISHISLLQCFDLFSREELIGEEESWYCPMCKDQVRAYKQIQINRAPPIMIIHLKRFYKLNGTPKKNNELIDFTLKQDFSTCIRSKSNKSTYQLYGIINHSGSVGFGHYTSQCYNFMKNCWYNYDDSKCIKMKDPPQPTPNACVLFYKRDDVPFEIEDYSIIREVCSAQKEGHRTVSSLMPLGPVQNATTHNINSRRLSTAEYHS